MLAAIKLADKFVTKGQIVKAKLIILFIFICSTSSIANTKWTFSAGGMIAGNPVVYNENIYITGGSKLYALNKQGKEVWHFDTRSIVKSQVAITTDKIIFNADSGLYCLNHEGNLLWFFSSADKVNHVKGTSYGWGDEMFPDDWALYRSSPLIVDDTVYFGNAQGTYAIDISKGKQRWHLDTGVTHTRPAYEEGTLVVGSWDNNLYGINAVNGSVSWQVRAELPRDSDWQGWKGFHLSPTIHKGTVFVGARGTYFYALNVETGKVRWSSKVGNTWIGSQALIDKELVHYGLSDGYSVVSRKLTNGNPIKVFHTDFYVFAQPQSDEHYLYVANMGGEIYAVDKTNWQGVKIFSTPASQKNLDKLKAPHGGLSFPHSSKGGFTYENNKKDVQLMFSQLDSVTSLTHHQGVLYAGSASGNLYAIPVPSSQNSQTAGLK